MSDGARIDEASVSVVIVDGGDEAAVRASLDALRGVRWPDGVGEVIVVGERRHTTWAGQVAVRAVPSDAALAGALNAGAEAASGTWLAFLRAGGEPAPAWLTAALNATADDFSISCVASQIEDSSGVPTWSPALSLIGIPLVADVPRLSGRQDVLFASADAMIVKRDAFRSAGGFDERYGDVLHDVDLGWRLWVLGHRVHLVPESVVRYAVVPAVEPAVENGLFTIFKNYDDATLAAALPATLTLAAAGAESGRGAARPVTRFFENLPSLADDRRRIQSRRVRTDREIVGLFRFPLRLPQNAPVAPEAWNAAVEALGVCERFGRRQRVLVATADTLSSKMAGPAIRAWHIAEALAQEHDVRLVTTAAVADIGHPRFAVEAVDEQRLEALEKWCDIFVFQGWVMVGRPYLRDSSKIVVVDLYDPIDLEELEKGRASNQAVRFQQVADARATLTEQLLRGDFFVCASEKQRDFWLGQLSGLGRVNPLTYDEDGTMQSLIRVVPFGMPDDPPVHRRQAVRGVMPGIGHDDKLLLWGGGIYDWFDPLTLLRAVDGLRRRVPDVRLLFMGLRHPNPSVSQSRVVAAARSLADSLALTGTHVFFNDGWVDYDDRQNYLLEADVGVTTHLAHLEARLAFRTRVLDYLWATLPIVATEGDALADLVSARELGLTVPPGDVRALEDALYRVLDDEGFRKNCRENIRRAAADLTWSKALGPLTAFCRDPRRAPDLVRFGAPDMDPDRLPADLPPTARPSDLRVLVQHLRDGGPRLALTKAAGRIRRLLH